MPLLDGQPRVFQDLPQSLLDIAPVDPGGAEPGVDLPRPQVGRQRAAQRGDVDVEPRVVPGCLPGLAELGADLAGQVFRRRDQAAGAGLVMIRATAATWCGRGSKLIARPGRDSWASS